MEIYQIGEILLGVSGLLFFITLIPFIISLIKKRRRLFWLGIFLSSFIALGVGGWLSETYKTEEAEMRVKTRHKISELESRITDQREKVNELKRKTEDVSKLITMIEESKTIEYRVIDADANFMKGTPLFYTGKVVQIEKSKNET